LPTIGRNVYWLYVQSPLPEVAKPELEELIFSEKFILTSIVYLASEKKASPSIPKYLSIEEWRNIPIEVDLGPSHGAALENVPVMEKRLSVVAAHYNEVLVRNHA